MYRFNTTKGILFKGDITINRDDRDEEYIKYIEYLKSGGSVESFEDNEPDDLKKAQAVIDDARAFGKQTINAFMNEALINGANENGKSSEILTYLMPVVIALEIGSLHAAVEYLDKMVEGDEFKRPGYPYTSTASLLKIRQMLVSRIS